MPQPVATGEATEPVDAECVECGAHADDVEQAVDRADLVEVHVVGRQCRGPRPRPSASALEDRDGGGAHAGREIGDLEKLPDRAPRARG